MFICQAGLIAALYTVLTIVSAYFGLASYEIQVRISEALTVLPLFTPAAIPGLFIGCLISNILAGGIFWDVIFGSLASLIGAYGAEGNEWAKELCEVITGNVDFACHYIAEHFAGVEVSRPQGTYMLFLDCTKWCEENGKTIDDVLKACYDVGVAVQDGRQFHGNCHIRMNLALPFSRVQEAFRRLEEHVFHA